MIPLHRTNTSWFGRWWWTVDRVLLLFIGALIFCGLWLVMVGSPAVAEKKGLGEMYFFHRQLVFMGASLLVMLAVSLMDIQKLLWLAVAVLLGSLVLMVAVILYGEAAKGSTRWIRLGGMSLQPSEFMKPGFVVVTAWLFSERFRQKQFPGQLWAMGLFGVIAVLLLLQPDVGMTVAVSLVWGAMFFLAGLSWVWVIALSLGAVGFFICAYLMFPHVAARVNGFLDPAAEGNYQVLKSLEAFRNGSWFGVGTGEGVVKRTLPDSHTDFIFAVAGEEAGVFACLFILGLIGAIVFHTLNRARQEKDLFVMLASSGMSILFGVQALINIGVSVKLLPTKGMTLPLVSYGGSSTFAYAIAMGMLLALTRKRYGN